MASVVDTCIINIKFSSRRAKKIPLFQLAAFRSMISCDHVQDNSSLYLNMFAVTDIKWYDLSLKVIRCPLYLLSFTVYTQVSYTCYSLFI